MEGIVVRHMSRLAAAVVLAPALLLAVGCSTTPAPPPSSESSTATSSPAAPSTASSAPSSASPSASVPAETPTPSESYSSAAQFDNSWDKGEQAKQLTVQVGKTVVIPFGVPLDRMGVRLFADGRPTHVEPVVQKDKPVGSQLSFRGTSEGMARLGMFEHNGNGAPLDGYTMYEITVTP